MAGIMQGGGDGLQNGRAEGFYARGIRSIPGLFTPPYSPPKPHARAARHPCKIRSQHHQNSRQTASTGHTSHTSTTSTKGTAAQHRATSTTRRPTPQHHSQHQPTPQTASTTPGQADRHDGGDDRPEDDQRTGPESRRYSRRGQ